MAFPTTGILDNFNRADESPAVGWTDSIDGSAYGNVRVVSNQLAAVTTDAYSYWNAATYGPDCEHYLTLAVSATVSLYARLNPIGSGNVDGYEVEIAPASSRVRIKRMDDNGVTQLGADITQAFSAGDSIGIECIGDQISAYYKAAAGSWTLIGTRTDATYNQAGYLGHYIPSTTPRIDDFGGGTVVPPAPSGTTRRRRSLTGAGR